jgi:uracil-DNA glycosylase
METASLAPRHTDYASVLRWWHDAGVDTLIDETPRRWLTVPKAETPRQRRDQPAVQPAVKAANPVQFDTLDALKLWLMTAPDVPGAGPPHRRVAPSGRPGAALMVIGDCPDAADIDAGMLLSGALGPLFENMLTALERTRDTIYLASLCPGRPPSGRLSPDMIESLTPSLRQHIALVAPQQLWLMGTAASCAVLGIGDIEAHGKLHTVNLDHGKVDTLVTAHPRYLTDREKKLRAWTEMQRLITKEIS